MKLEFLDDISDGGKYPWADPNQLVRLYDFGHLQANKLKQEIKETIISQKKDLQLSTLDFIESVNCKLTLHISDKNIGIVQTDTNNFLCNLTISSYEEMLLLMNSFTEKDVHGYQWLYDIDTPIDFLFSPGGTW